LFHVNKRARSYAFPYRTNNGQYYYIELGVVFNDTPAVYAHEILHLFGAVDFYRVEEENGVTAEVMAHVKKHFPKDIMVTNYGKGGKIPNELTRLTALGLGWISDVPELDQFPRLKTEIPGAFAYRREEHFHQDDEYEYTLKDGRATITKYLIRFEKRALVIPDTVDGYPVTGIGPYAFIDLDVDLTSVALPAGLTHIEGNPFSKCKSLTRIEVPPDHPAFTLIDGVLFDKNQKTLVACPPGRSGAYAVPPGVEVIGDGAFRNCTGLAEITLPDSVTRIGDSAFSDCIGLSGITLPEVVTHIGKYAFWSCKRLTGLILPDSVASIGDYAFGHCKSLTTMTLPPGLSSVGKFLFAYCDNLTSVRIPEVVTSIGDSAFAGCISLTAVTLPDGVISIGDSAFAGCISLTAMTLPDRVTSIGMAAFSHCTGLTGMTIPAGVKEIGERAFLNCTNLTLSVFKGSYGEQYAKENEISYVYAGK